MKLLELRQQAGYSQQEIADKIGITQEKYSRLENNITKIEPELLIKLSNVYGTSIDYLCGRQWNNQIGYIPDNKKNTIQKLLELDDMNFQRVDTYINARFEVQEEQQNIKKAEE